LQAVAEDFEFGGIFRELPDEIVKTRRACAVADDVAEAAK